MGVKAFLGEFEHLVLAASLRLEPAYGAALIREIEERTGRQVQAGSLYITLDRLEKKGLIVSSAGEQHSSRGGRPSASGESLPAAVRDPEGRR